MAKKTPTLYSIDKTFFWFALISILLTGSLIAIVVLDHHREWKSWQKKFIRLKTELTQKELRDAGQKIDKKRLGDLEGEMAKADGKLRDHRKDYEDLSREIEALNTRVLKAKSKYQDIKQYEDSYRYYFEETSARQDPRAKDYEKLLAGIRPKLSRAKSDLEALEKQKEEKEAALRTFTAEEKELKKAIDKILEDKTRVERKLKAVKPTIAKEILNAPMVDFLHPSLQIQQVVLEDLEDDYHFAKVQKVDRCTTCHLGIDQKGFENAPQPFRSHPKLDLYVGSASAHPIEKFGCTVCHSGNGHSVSFKDSAHTPKNEEQAAEWRKKYRWEELEKWDAKMLPLQHVQAACAKCHQNTVQVPQADKLNQGRALAGSFGCFNCHKISGFENRWKAGPDLRHIQSKLTQDWVVRWLQDPTRFRASTKMPKIFHLSNNASPEDRQKDDVAIEAIAAYLVKNSEPIELSKPPMPGNPDQGEKLVKELGCLGCHAAAGVRISRFGAELSGLGSKVTPEWLYTWLKDPKHYSENTRMPNLRLSDEEAADITRYLLSLKNEAFEKSPVPSVDPAVADSMVLGFLEGNMRRTEAEAELHKMNAEEKMLFLGKKSIAHQGCYSCHAIKGFEDTKPIGADLSNEGRKDLHQFDFGFVPIERSRQAWIAQKLKDPRVFDRGKLKTYHEKLRMPQFNFTDEEIDALTAFVLSLTEESVPLEMQRRLTQKEEMTEKGRLLVQKLNCAGCHSLDGQEGALRAFLEDKGAAPPILEGEGAKVQEKWLHEFLQAPGTIRPWLKVRMPTFGLTEEDTKTLVQYLANLSHEEVSYKGLEQPASSPEKLEAGKKLFEKLQCAKCHRVDAVSAAMGSSFLAPDLGLTRSRLKPNWVKQWLADPQTLQEGTMMPTFFPEGQSPVGDILGGNAQQQIEAIRDYLYTYTAE